MAALNNGRIHRYDNSLQGDEATGRLVLAKVYPGERKENDNYGCIKRVDLFYLPNVRRYYKVLLLI